MSDDIVQSSFSKFAFLFLIFTVVSGGYVSEVLSCQMQKFLSTSTYGRHLVGMLMVFVFIMMEGGWSFSSQKNDKAENNWSSGNVMDSMVMALIIYAIFVLSSKTSLLMNTVFFALLFALYCLNTQRSFWLARGLIKEETSQAMIKVQYMLVALALAALAYGVYDYTGYQKKQYGSNFSWSKFALGTARCSSLKNN